jgi:hypothetical protein
MAMPGTTILWLVLAYVAIAVLLLSMNLTSRWRWWIKAMTILVTAGFFVGSYFAIISVLGWSTREDPPERFALLATRVVEPDRVTGAQGTIFLWLEEIDENNVPSGRPRSYSLTYTQDFANAVSQAHDLLANGEKVEGSLVPHQQKTDQEAAATPPSDADGRQLGTPFPSTGHDLVFNNMPPVQLPEKALL